MALEVQVDKFFKRHVDAKFPREESGFVFADGDRASIVHAQHDNARRNISAYQAEEMEIFNCELRIIFLDKGCYAIILQIN